MDKIVEYQLQYAHAEESKLLEKWPQKIYILLR